MKNTASYEKSFLLKLSIILKMARKQKIAALKVGDQYTIHSYTKSTPLK